MFSSWDPGTKVIPPELNSSRSCLHKLHSSRKELSSWEERLHGIFRHGSSQCLGQGFNRPGMKSSQGEIVKTATRKRLDTEMNSGSRDKSHPGAKLSCKRAHISPHAMKPYLAIKTVRFLHELTITDRFFPLFFKILTALYFPRFLYRKLQQALEFQVLEC